MAKTDWLGGLWLRTWDGAYPYFWKNSDGSWQYQPKFQSRQTSTIKLSYSCGPKTDEFFRNPITEL